MKMPLLTVSILLLLSVSGTYSQEHAIDVSTGDCMEADPSTSGSINCYMEAETKWDEELNRNYKLLMSATDDETQKKLKAAQLAWIKLRDAEFEFLSYLYGQMQGTMFRTFYYGKRVSVVRSRALELKNFYDDYQTSKE